MEEYIPYVVGAGMFLGSIFAGVWKGKKEIPEENSKQIVSGVLQDNYSMLMMSEQLRTNKEEMSKVIQTMKELINEMERLREYARDISKVLETKIRM